MLAAAFALVLVVERLGDDDRRRREPVCCDELREVERLDDAAVGEPAEAAAQLLRRGPGVSDAEVAELAGQIEALVDERFPALLEAYERLRLALGQPVGGPVDGIATFQREFLGRLADARTVDDLAAATAGGAAEVADRQLELDRLGRDECGSVLAD